MESATEPSPKQQKFTTKILWAAFLTGQVLLYTIVSKWEPIPPRDAFPQNFVFLAFGLAIGVLLLKNSLRSASFFKKAISRGSKNPHSIVFINTIIGLALSEAIYLLGFILAREYFEQAKLFMAGGFALTALMFPDFSVVEKVLKDTKSSV